MYSDNRTSRQLSKRTQVFEKLNSEHAGILVGFAGLGALVKDRSLTPTAVFGVVRATLSLLERHQEKEERFLFPLLFEPENMLFRKFRSEHLEYLRLSDTILSAARSRDPGMVAEFVVDFKSKMESHFFREEAIVLEKAACALSNAQLDILCMTLGKGKQSAL